MAISQPAGHKRRRYIQRGYGNIGARRNCQNHICKRWQKEPNIRCACRAVPIASIETSDAVCSTDEPIPVEQLPAYEALFRAVPLVGVAGLGFALLGYFSLFGYPAGTKKCRLLLRKSAQVRRFF